MKSLAIILVAFSLSGCIYQTVDQYDMAEAIEICGGVDKIANIHSTFVGNEGVTCMDNRKILLHQK